MADTTEYPPLDLGNWSFENFQKQYLAGQEALNNFNQYVADQAAQGKSYTSPIGDPLTMSLVPGLLGLYGATPEEQALQYFGLKSRETYTPITFDPRTYGGGYQLVDGSGAVIARAASASELESIIADAATRTGAKDAYSIEGIRGNGEVDTIFKQTKDSTLGDMLVNMAAVALPAVGGLVLGPALAGTGALGIGVSPAVGIGLGTAAGTAASGAAAGKSIEDILIQSAIAGIAAGGIQALAGSPAATSNKVSGLIADLQPQVLDGALSVAEASKTLANAGASAADIARFTADVGGAAASAVPTVIGNVASSAAPVIAGTAGAAVGSILPPPATVVTAPTTPAPVEPAAPPPVVPPILPPPATVVTAPTTPAPVEPAAPPPVVPPTDIVVNAPKSPTEVLAEEPAKPITSVPIPPLAGTTLPSTGDSLLKDILKYYSLGSGLLDMLGVGQGGAGTATTPYTSSLGPAPTFTRGQFQPFSGDYETYAFGPEWSFFNQPTQPQTPQNVPFPFLLPPSTTGA